MKLPHPPPLAMGHRAEVETEGKKLYSRLRGFGMQDANRVSLDCATIVFLVLMHREYVLKLIPFESEHPVLEMGVCEALKHFDVLVHQNSVCLPYMEGGHACVTRPGGCATSSSR